MKIYLSFGSQSDPNEFDHDVAYLNVNRQTIVAEDLLPAGVVSYVIAVYIEAMDSVANEAQNNSLSVETRRFT